MVTPAGDSSDSQTTRNEGWLLTGWKLKQIGQKKQKGKANHTSPTQDAPTEEWERNKKKNRKRGKVLELTRVLDPKIASKKRILRGTWELRVANDKPIFIALL